MPLSNLLQSKINASEITINYERKFVLNRTNKSLLSACIYLSMKSRMVIHNAVKVDRDIKVFRCWRNACKNSKMFWMQSCINLHAIHTSIPKKPFDHFWFISPVFYKLMSATLQKKIIHTCFPLNFVNSCKFSQNTCSGLTTLLNSIF